MTPAENELLRGLVGIYRQRLQRRLTSKEPWWPGPMGDDLAGRRSRLKRLHAEALMRQGKTKQEAWKVPNELDSQAFRLVGAEAEQMGFTCFPPPPAPTTGQNLSLF